MLHEHATSLSAAGHANRSRRLIKCAKDSGHYRIAAAAILDRDYRSDVERVLIAKECSRFCELVAIHECKEIENFLLVPAAINRAAVRKISDQSKRSGYAMEYLSDAATLLGDFALRKKSYVMSQYLAERRRFERVHSPTAHEASVNEIALNEFEETWKVASRRLAIIPGKEAISFLNQHLQDDYGVSITPTAIVDPMRLDEIPAEVQKLVQDLSKFSAPISHGARVAWTTR
jgi:hypothetical protein